MSAPHGFTFVFKTHELAPGDLRRVEVEGHVGVVGNVDGDFHALADSCPHHGASLSEGTLKGTRLTCPWHAWSFDITDGRCLVIKSMGADRWEVMRVVDDVYAKPATNA